MRKRGAIIRTLSRLLNTILSVPIYFKILGIGALTASVFGLLTFYQVQISYTKNLYDSLKKFSLASGLSLSHILTEPVVTNDYFTLHKIIQDKFEHTPEIEYIVVEKNGKLIASVFKSTKIKESYINSIFSNDFSNRLTVLELPDRMVLNVTFPILEGFAGTLKMGFSDIRIREILHKITKNLLITLIICILLGQGLAFALTYILTRPIDYLMTASEEIKKGNFDTSAKVLWKDEIGEFAGAFNRMVEGLKKYRKEIKKREEERLSLMRRIVEIQEEERKRISRELHDQLGQDLSSLLWMVQTSSKKELEKAITKLIENVRNLSMDLRPPLLDDYGLKVALEKYINDMEKYSGMSIKYQYISSRNKNLSTFLKINLYRIAQEAILNAIRHSKAKNISVVIMEGRENITLIVEDDGQGFDTKIAKEDCCMGIIGMRERTTLLGGDFIIESSPGQGTIVRVKVPIGGGNGDKDFNF